MGDRLTQLQEKLKTAMSDRNTRLAVIGMAAVAVVAILIIILVTALGGAGSPPLAPAGLQASAESYNRVSLSWVDNSDNEAGFEVQRSEIDQEEEYRLLGRVTAGTTTYADTKVSEDTTYFYRVKAYNSAGHSAFTNVASADVPRLEPPNAPSNLAAVAESSGRIKLTWWDNSDNEESFHIERRAEEGTWAALDIDPPLGADTTEYSDSDGLVEESVYHYRIRASNVKGYSQYSAEASAQTLPPVEHEWGGTAGGLLLDLSVTNVVLNDRYCEYNPMNPGSRKCTAPSGTRFAIVTASISNKTTDMELEASSERFQLRNKATRDPYGVFDYEHGNIGEPFPGYVLLDPGETVSGVIVYLIPASHNLDDMEVVVTTGGDTIHIWRG